MSFSPFDPLAFKNTKVNDAALGALKREINNILSSYVGWYDPFCELIQNALDAVEARSDLEKSAGNVTYTPKINVLIDLDANTLTVSDNGIGLDREKFEQFLAPNFSFKSNQNRGHKGVGATYVAYGFNYMKISTKAPAFEESGRIINAKKWLTENISGDNPKVEPDNSIYTDEDFEENDRGVSITVRFDESTQPKRLDWIKANTAEQWKKILSIKTGLGSIIEDETIEVKIRVIHNKNKDEIKKIGTGYLWLHKSAKKISSIRDLKEAAHKAHEKYGAGYKLSDKYSNLDFIFDSWTSNELEKLIGSALDEEEREILKKHTPHVSVEFGYTAKLWHQFNDTLGVRSGYRVLTSGIQLAANNMPQGETIQIPLKRNIGRQNQIHFLFHFDKYSPDLGRKGFHRELSDFSKNVSRLIVENHLSKLRRHLKANTGTSPDLVRELEISDWKKTMLTHEEIHPLHLESKYFFLPTERVSITSKPTREQDVIALFHQLIAGGVIRGINIMSTNERFTYDGLFKVSFDLDSSIYEYEEAKNPLGVPAETAKALCGRVTPPKILEYKFCLDGLIEDFENQDKNIKDIDLCVVWNTGDMYQERYGITSLLLRENSDQRQYHGVTHILSDIETGARYCDLIVLSELIQYLNKEEKFSDQQREKYE